MKTKSTPTPALPPSMLDPHTASEEAPSLRSHLIVTVYFALQANDDQGATEPIRTMTHRRRLPDPDMIITRGMVHDACMHAEAITTATIAFEHNNAYRCVIRSSSAKIETDLI